MCWFILDHVGARVLDAITAQAFLFYLYNDPFTGSNLGTFIRDEKL